MKNKTTWFLFGAGTVVGLSIAMRCAYRALFSKTLDELTDRYLLNSAHYGSW